MIEVTKGIYRGPVLETITYQLGLKSILNLQTGGDTEELSQCYRNGIALYDFDMLGFWVPKIEDVQLALSIMADSNTHPIYVHCRHGRERTGLLCAIYRMHYQDWSFGKAHEEMVRLGCRWTHSWMLKYLEERVG